MLSPLEEALQFALNGGDDYELCFTAPPQSFPDCVMIGEITAATELNLRFTQGQKYNGDIQGYQHFG